MEMKFIKAYRYDENTVNIVYSFDEIEATVVWSNIDEGTGEEIQYYILDIKSDNKDLENRLINVKNLGENNCDNDEDEYLYLFIRDSFGPDYHDDI